jgi:hypothetical protein
LRYSLVDRRGVDAVEFVDWVTSGGSAMLIADRGFYVTVRSFTADVEQYAATAASPDSPHHLSSTAQTKERDTMSPPPDNTTELMTRLNPVRFNTCWIESALELCEGIWHGGVGEVGEKSLIFFPPIHARVPYAIYNQP